MYLKSLKLIGFKSFADRTRLEFRPGVTVVVGPNGSGKSNVVDAVAWVMGTQSTRALRTGKMEDVVFAGTATRPALGRAEVTLVLDNASGALPLDLPEVSVTRRLYRDGSSDYEINGVACRLLDIQELLSDSGVGRHQHVIVGQGQIDTVLNAGPDDHRAVIEEAAGILKHRARKDRAIRRLERSEGDVLRLRDLLGELRRQMRPLERQANAAAKRDSLAARERSLRLYLGGEELRRIDATTTAISEEREILATDKARAEASAGELASAVSILTSQAAGVGEVLDRDTGAAARLETTIERLRRIAQVAHERHRAAVMRRDGAQERRRDLDEERNDLERALAGIAAEAQSLEDAAASAEQHLRTLEDEERSLAGQEGMSVEGALAAVRGELGSLEAAAARDTAERRSLEGRSELLAERIVEEARRVDQLRDEIRDLDGEVTRAQRAYEAAGSQRARDQELWESAEADHSEARVAVAAARAALEAVSDAVAGRADPEARAMAEAADGAHGSLIGRLDVPPGLEAAVDAALGPWSDAVAFRGRGAVEEAATELKGSGRGGVPMVAPVPGRSLAATVAEDWGLEALVDRLGAQADRGLAVSLLGDVVVAEGWSAAWSLVEKNPAIRVVTPEGDLITAAGIKVAHPDGVTPAMLETAQVGLERAETELARAASRLTAARRDFDRTRAQEREALEALESLEARLGGATEALARLERSREASEGERDQLSGRLEHLQRAEETRQAQIDRLAERLRALEGEEAERQRAWEVIAERRRQVSEQREQARREWQAATAAVHAADERRALHARRLEAVLESLAAEEASPSRPEDLERLVGVERTARLTLEAIQAKLGELRERQALHRARAKDLGGRLEQVRARHQEAQSTVSRSGERLGELAVTAAELRVRRESVSEGLRRDADASEEEALAAETPEGAGETDLVAELESLEAQLRRMGPVNPLAAEEFRELSERHDFLAAQLDDLERSREELRKVVRALDEEIRERFVTAFEEVAAGYAEHFALLFPGGRGRLVLTAPDDPLTSGVDIEAQPLGKKVSRMSLLSGGERSLAALAFLFAIFRARPSPFYILDEVEAALDDANLRRFLRLLDRFRQDAQLIVITHQQQTMETADVLYGVTMEPGGSSRVVAKALDRSRVPDQPASDVSIG